jgi:hypothetical protein
MALSLAVPRAEDTASAAEAAGTGAVAPDPLRTSLAASVADLLTRLTAIWSQLKARLFFSFLASLSSPFSKAHLDNIVELLINLGPPDLNLTRGLNWGAGLAAGVSALAGGRAGGRESCNPQDETKGNETKAEQ